MRRLRADASGRGRGPSSTHPWACFCSPRKPPPLSRPLPRRRRELDRGGIKRVGASPPPLPPRPARVSHLLSQPRPAPMTTTVTVHAAKTHLSRLIEQALRGEEVIIARGDKPVVRLVPVEAPKPRRVLRHLEGPARGPRQLLRPAPRGRAEALGRRLSPLAAPPGHPRPPVVLAGDLRLPVAARAAIDAPGADVLVSAVSLFKIATKHRLGKLPLEPAVAADLAGTVVGHGFARLPQRRARQPPPRPARPPASRPGDHRRPRAGLHRGARFETYGVRRLWSEGEVVAHSVT